MRKSTFIILCLLISLFSSCSKNNRGYPEKIVFDKSGGTLNITGAYPPQDVYISDYDGNRKGSDPFQKEGTIVVVKDWLTVSGAYKGKSFDVTAGTNDTGKRRKLFIRLSVFNDHPEILVIQKK